MIAFEPAPGARVALRRPVYGAGVYVVPRAGTRILIGATSEEAGFDIELTADAAGGLSDGARRLIPALHTLVPVDQWSGLRPMTSDSLPVLGTDPEFPTLIYACGHSRNGILLAPLTGDVVAAIVSGGTVGHDLAQFRPARF